MSTITVKLFLENRMKNSDLHLLSVLNEKTDCEMLPNNQTDIQTREKSTLDGFDDLIL